MPNDSARIFSSCYGRATGNQDMHALQGAFTASQARSSAQPRTHRADDEACRESCT